MPGSALRRWRAFAACACLLLAGCASLPVADAQAADANERADVVLLPFGDIPNATVEQLAAHIRDTHKLVVSIAQRKSITKQMIDYERRQVAAQEFIAYLEPRYFRQQREPRAVYLGVTNYDLYVQGLDWEYAFAARKPPGLAVVSGYRMDPFNFDQPPNDALVLQRMRKMVSKTLGDLHFGLKDSDDPKSLMYGGIRTLEDLDRVGDAF